MSELTDTLAIGRFSSKMLQQYGAQKTAQQNGGKISNRFAFSKGGEYYYDPTTIVLTDIALETGSVQEDVFTAIFGYFQSKGASTTNAQTMAAIIIDTAKYTGKSPMSILDSFDGSTKTALDLSAYKGLNALRSVSDQQEVVSDINNNKSLKSRSIRA